MDNNRLIQLAYEEDLPQGDVTTDNLQHDHKISSARLIAKEDLILSGHRLFQACFEHMDPKIKIKWFFSSGDLILNGQTVAKIEGVQANILKAERVALNFLGHLSGIASLTKAFVAATEGTDCKILDTRKTTPLLRQLEKSAVRDGGGHNHRLNLSDGIMIKDNHIDMSGSITKAVQSIRKNSNLSIEVECKNIDEVKEAISLSVHRVMLDNMDTESLKSCIDIIPSSIEIEVSGNMTVERVREIAPLGPNFISVGSLTHSAPQADFSLRMEMKNG